MPFEANLRTGHPVLAPPHLDGPDPRWIADGARLALRVARAAGPGARGVAHVGPTAVPGLPAVDVVDLQLAVDPEQAGPAAVEAIRSGLDAAGYPRTDDAGDDVAAGQWWHAGADPGRPVRLAVRVAGSPGWRAALLWRDWLRADEEARSAYRTAVADDRTDEAASAREFTRAEEWAASSGWRPSLEELPGPR